MDLKFGVGTFALVDKIIQQKSVILSSLHHSFSAVKAFMRFVALIHLIIHSVMEFTLKPPHATEPNGLVVQGRQPVVAIRAPIEIGAKAKTAAANHSIESRYPPMASGAVRDSILRFLIMAQIPAEKIQHHS